MEKQAVIQQLVIDFKSLSGPEKLEVLDILMQNAINAAKEEKSNK